MKNPPKLVSARDSDSATARLGNASLLSLPGATALLRNRFVLDHAAEIVVGTLEPGGSLATLLRAYSGRPLRVFHELPNHAT